ncbi:hypothetical protein ILYODFUR_010920 [Ilyodon furcidens]|uniref:Agouti signaling protein n=1 Tax=Ilyodon furcidens TaxID=33524 RepID=A0ABV0UI54_9TELE
MICCYVSLLLSLPDSGNTHSEKDAEMKNGLDSRKPAAAATNSSSSEPQSRKDSSDMKPCLHAKGNSTDSKAVRYETVLNINLYFNNRFTLLQVYSKFVIHRRESTDSKKCSSPPAKKIMGER